MSDKGNQTGLDVLVDEKSLSSMGVARTLPLDEILQYLKIHGERLDTEIAKAVGMTLAAAQVKLSALSAAGEIMTCHTIRFDKGRKVEGMICRLSGFMPKAAPGRKPKAQIKLP